MFQLSSNIIEYASYLFFYSDKYSHRDDQRHMPERERDNYNDQEGDSFDFTKHKYSLNKIFFRNQDLIKRFDLCFV